MPKESSIIMTERTIYVHMALVKKHFCTGKNETSFVSPHLYLNEASFVPNPDGVSEDDMFPVLDLQIKLQTGRFSTEGICPLSVQLVCLSTHSLKHMGASLTTFTE